MTNFERAQLAKKISNLYFTPWHERKKEDRQKLKSMCQESYDDFYGYVINEFITSQPDKESLIKLFIAVGFRPLPFFQIIIQPPPGKKSVPKVA